MDRNANTIGALMLHLAATETYYQLNTFENKKWDTWADSVKQQWDAAMNLGDAGPENHQGPRSRLLPEHPPGDPCKIAGGIRQARRHLAYGRRQRLALGSNQQFLQVVPCL